MDSQSTQHPGGSDKTGLQSGCWKGWPQEKRGAAVSERQGSLASGSAPRACGIRVDLVAQSSTGWTSGVARTEAWRQGRATSVWLQPLTVPPLTVAAECQADHTSCRRSGSGCSKTSSLGRSQIHLSGGPEPGAEDMAAA